MQSGTVLDWEVDRLSSLPDDLIHKILLYVDIESFIKLSVLSSRLRLIWTSIRNLDFPSDQVSKISSLSRVNDVLSARNNKIDVSSVSFYPGYFPELSVKRILEYAFSHNVQQLCITGKFEFSLSQLSSKSLKHLTMIRTTLNWGSRSSPWDLPALTTLHLKDVELDNCTFLLAMCQNLKDLTLEGCKVFGTLEGCKVFGSSRESFRISIVNSRLLSLTLKKVVWYVDFVHVDTPQLKNLILVGERRQFEFPGELTISSRDLTYLCIKGSYLPKLSSDGFPSLEKADLWISSSQKTDVHKILDLFQHLHSVKSLSLSLEIAELLSTSEEVISQQTSPFPSLKRLMIYPSEGGLKALDLENLRIYPFERIFDKNQEAMKTKLSPEVKNYLLGSSSNATFTMVSHEEARITKFTIAADRLMAALWKDLEKIEAYTDAKRAKVEWKKTLPDGCHKDITMRVIPPGKPQEIFRTLENIRVLLTKVLASKRVEMQACLSRLCAKTKTVVSKMVVDMKNQCDIEEHIFSEYLDEIALSSSKGLVLCGSN